MRALAGAGADARFAMPDGTTILMEAIVVSRAIGTFRARRSPRAVPRPREHGGSPTAKMNASRSRRSDTRLQWALVTVRPIKTATRRSARRPPFSLNSVVQLLAERGADLEARNNRGQTPLASIIARSSRAPAARISGAWTPAPTRQNSSENWARSHKSHFAFSAGVKSCAIARAPWRWRRAASGPPASPRSGRTRRSGRSCRRRTC